MINEVAASLPLEPDDLTRIEGIGPKINQLLNEAGIMSFAQLAQPDVKDQQSILHQAGPRYSMADPASWPEQARLAAAGDWEALQTLTEQLRGGR